MRQPRGVGMPLRLPARGRRHAALPPVCSYTLPLLAYENGTPLRHVSVVSIL